MSPSERHHRGRSEPNSRMPVKRFKEIRGAHTVTARRARRSFSARSRYSWTPGWRSRTRQLSLTESQRASRPFAGMRTPSRLMAGSPEEKLDTKLAVAGSGSRMTSRSGSKSSLMRAATLAPSASRSTIRASERLNSWTARWSARRLVTRSSMPRQLSLGDIAGAHDNSMCRSRSCGAGASPPGRPSRSTPGRVGRGHEESRAAPTPVRPASPVRPARLSPGR